MRIRPLPAIRSLGLSAWMASLLLGAVLGATASYWAVVLLAPPAPIAPPPLASESTALPELQQAALMFGNPQAAAAAAKSSNIKVLGILAAGDRGSAILSVDGGDARAFAVDESITPGQRLREVRSDAVVIGNGTSQFELAAPAISSLAVLSSGPNQPPSSARPAAPVRVIPPRQSPTANTARSPRPAAVVSRKQTER